MTNEHELVLSIFLLFVWFVVVRGKILEIADNNSVKLRGKKIFINCVIKECL